MPVIQRVNVGKELTWTVLGPDNLPLPPVEEFLEFMRNVRSASPHTIRSYAASLAGLFDFFEHACVEWDKLDLRYFSRYVALLRSGEEVGTARLPVSGDADLTRAESTVATRVAAVTSFYRYHEDAHGVAVASRLYRASGRHRHSRYVSALAHTARGEGRDLVVRVRRGDGRPVPVLSPDQVRAILDDCARFDPQSGEWEGVLRDRLVFATMAETGLRLGECLALCHCDWHTGRGATPYLEVVPRDDHPHGLRVKYGRHRKVYVSDDLERLYSEYLWQLVDAGAADEIDLEGHYVFVNLSHGERFAPMRPETVYAKVRAVKAHLGSRVPKEWTPHWFRHSHASALLLAGCAPHVVMRRLGHADIQTTLNLYGWVTEDAELKALGDWQSLCNIGDDDDG